MLSELQSVVEAEVYNIKFLSLSYVVYKKQQKLHIATWSEDTNTNINAIYEMTMLPKGRAAYPPL